MRIRRVIAVGVFAAVPLLMPTAAHASGEGIAVGECTVEETREVADAVLAENQETFDQLVEDCFSAESPIIPKWSEVIWGGLAWLLVMIIVVKFALPALRKTLKAREDKIREDLEAAESAKGAAVADRDALAAQLANARTEASQIIEEARRDADRVRQERIAAIEGEANELRARAQEDIRLAQERALADLRSQVASMSIELAEKIVERNLDQATQQALIDSYINSVGKN